MPTDTEDTVILSDQVMEQLAEWDKTDPKKAEAVRSMLANMRQAHAAWLAGQYDSFPEAVEAITGQRPTRIDTEDDDLERDD